MKQRHPKGLYLLFFAEMWERFSYYGMRAILVLYVIDALRLSQHYASELYGSFTGLVYLTPLIGGYVADRYWGNRHSILMGGVLIALGQFLMFLSATFYDQLALALPLMYGGLGVLVLGNGFFKPCIGTMVGQLYPPNDNRKNSAYTIFYMGVNLGSFFAPLVCGLFGDTGRPEDFRWGYLCACLGMIMGIIVFERLKNRYLITPEGEPIGMPPVAKSAVEQAKEGGEVPKRSSLEFVLWGVGAVSLFGLFLYLFDYDFFAAAIYGACIVVPAFVITDRSLTKVEQDRIWVIYILSFFVIFFWAAFEQAGASLTIFAARQTDRYIGSWEMPTSFFQSFNPVFIVTLAPLFAGLWMFLAKRKIDPSTVLKQSFGLLMLAIGYLVIAFGVKDVSPGVKVSMMWLGGLYFLHTLGELCLSPIGLSMVNRLSPARFASLMMGVWYLSTATANKFAGLLFSLYPDPGEVNYLAGYRIASMFDFFMLFVFMAGAASLILFFLNGWLKKMMHGLE